MAPHDHRKQSLYFPQGMLDEIRREARRIERPISWVMQRSWIVAKASIKAIASAPNEESADAKRE